MFSRLKNKKINQSQAIKYEKSDGVGRVFISYQKASFDFVLNLSEYFEKNGVKTWYAPRNIKFGAFWPDKLCEAIKNCKALLLLYTEDADRSKHVMREVELADEFQKPILWVKLDTSEPSKTLKYFLTLIQSVEWDGNDGQVAELLLNILRQDKIDIDILKNSDAFETSIATADLQINQWSKGIYVFDSANLAGECAARVYFDIANNSPQTTILLPTGRSAKEIFYAMLRVAGEYKNCPFGEAHIMNDTETFGVKPSHPTSRIKAINDYLITPLKNMNKSPIEENITFMYGIGDEEEPDEIAQKALEQYPPSVYGISVSPYCEIIGYDLGVHTEKIVNDTPRVIQINDETREYIDNNQKSNSIYTVGMGTALNSKLLMILAFDKSKSNAISRLFKEDIDAVAPITLLRKHTNAYIIITKDIAEKVGFMPYAVYGKTPKEAAECITGLKQSF